MLDALRAALRAPVEADDSARLVDRTLSFADLPPIGEPGTIAQRGTVGLYEMEQVDFDNGARALLWQTDAEPGRVVVKLRFGAGQRAFDADEAVYAGLGTQALIGSGFGELGQEELDRITTGRRMGFTLGIEEDTFSFTAQTRGADLADQLYLFAAKLAQPRWDANPVLRAKASQRLTFESQQATPAGVLGRDLDWLLGDRDARLKAPDLAAIDAATPEGFRAAWEPLLATGAVEILVFGDFEKDAAVDALTKTIGALPERAPVSPDVLARSPRFPEQAGAPVMLTHRGDADQAAVAMAWQTGAGFDGVRTARQMQVLTDLFNNRLMDALRERAGASYAPQVGANWPLNMESGGTITAIAQLQPKDVRCVLHAGAGHRARSGHRAAIAGRTEPRHRTAEPGDPARVHGQYLLAVIRSRAEPPIRAATPPRPRCCRTSRRLRRTSCRHWPRAILRPTTC